MDIATFAAGCFWCTEAIFKQLGGVIDVFPGYTGGTVPNPTYEQVCTGATGHAEAVQIRFDPEVISYEDLLEVFWSIHDPTTLNRQGNDVGTQYRSAVFYHDEEQKAAAEKSKKQLQDSGKWPDPIVTGIVPFRRFFKAEEYHMDYYNRNRSQSYCRLIIDPKISKFKKQFQSKRLP